METHSAERERTFSIEEPRRGSAKPRAFSSIQHRNSPDDRKLIPKLNTNSTISIPELPEVEPPKLERGMRTIETEVKEVQESMLDKLVLQA